MLINTGVQERRQNMLQLSNNRSLSHALDRTEQNTAESWSSYWPCQNDRKMTDLIVRNFILGS